MKKIGDLMKEAGFNANAPDSIKEAYIKHLIRVSADINVNTPSEKKEMAENPQKIIPLKAAQQLSFDFVTEAPLTKSPKKASTF